MKVIEVPEMNTRPTRMLCRHALLYADKNYRNENHINAEVTLESSNDLDFLMDYLIEDGWIPDGSMEYNDWALTQAEFIPDPELDRAIWELVKALTPYYDKGIRALKRDSEKS